MSELMSEGTALYGRPLRRIKTMKVRPVSARRVCFADRELGEPCRPECPPHDKEKSKGPHPCCSAAANESAATAIPR